MYHKVQSNVILRTELENAINGLRYARPDLAEAWAILSKIYGLHQPPQAETFIVPTENDKRLLESRQ